MKIASRNLYFWQHAILMKKEWKFEYHAQNITIEKVFSLIFMLIMELKNYHNASKL